jgi:hypothetical protein
MNIIGVVGGSYVNIYIYNIEPATFSYCIHGLRTWIVEFFWVLVRWLKKTWTKKKTQVLIHLALSKDLRIGMK